MTLELSEPQVLIVDDDHSLRESICASLEHEAFNCVPARDGIQALSELQSKTFDLILCDLKMPRLDGLGFIRKCREVNSDVPIILMTAYGSTDLAIEAIRAGANDYIAKPFSASQLILTIRKAEEHRRLLLENAALRAEIQGSYSFSNIIARSECMQHIFETVQRLSAFSTTVLISGESGTGKELIARAIHHNSPRNNQRFVAVNCAAIPETLMESEFFGHRRGAFTDATRNKVGLFEEANGGTIFLDEIGEMPPHLQVKLLRVLQEQQIQPVGDEKSRAIDVRVIAATLRDLEQDVVEGRFRDDLYYRLNVVHIEIPPLRERPEDVPVLVNHFIEKYNQRLGTNTHQVSPQALRALLAYHWKGNVRELENCIERALVLSDSGVIDIASLPSQVQHSDQHIGAATLVRIDPDNMSIKQRTRALEQELIVRALTQTAGNRTHAAKLLEISHRALLYKLKEYGLKEVGKSTATG